MVVIGAKGEVSQVAGSPYGADLPVIHDAIGGAVGIGANTGCVEGVFTARSETDRATARAQDALWVGFRAASHFLAIDRHDEFVAGLTAVAVPFSIGAEGNADHSRTLRKDLVKLWPGNAIVDHDRPATALGQRRHVNSVRADRELGSLLHWRHHYRLDFRARRRRKGASVVGWGGGLWLRPTVFLLDLRGKGHRQICQHHRYCDHHAVSSRRVAHFVFLPC